MPSQPTSVHQYALTARRRLARSLRRAGAAIGSGRSPDALVTAALLPKTLRKDGRILDLRADGAELAALVTAGYSNSMGWAASATDADAMRRRHPKLRDTIIHVGPLRTVLQAFDDDDIALAIAPSAARSRLSDRDELDSLVRVASTVILVGPVNSAGDAAIASALVAAGMTAHAERRLRLPSSSQRELQVGEFRRMEQAATLHEFWRQPEPEGNEPALYVGRIGRSRALAAIIADVPTTGRILEIGCNVGRNLAYLHDRGYHNVEGIEINPNAIALLRKTFPQLETTEVHEGPAGEHMPKFADDEFDLIFTMAVIEHLHPDEASTVCDHMVRAGKEILAIEPEGRVSHRQFPHDVPATLQERGMELVSVQPMSGFLSTANDPTIHAYVAWRFRRQGATSVATTAPAPDYHTEVVNRPKAATDLASETTAAIRAEIESLIVQLERSQRPFRPSASHAAALCRLLDELELKGIDRFKTLSSAQQTYYRRYGQGFTTAHLESVARFVREANPSSQAAWVTTQLNGAIDAGHDLDIALAMIDRSVIDLDLLAHGESEVGAPPQRFRLAGPDGPAYGRPYLGYAKILAALSRVIGAPPRRVLELGGGFGVLGELLHQYRPDSVYVDVDIPPLTSIARWYLGQVVDGKPVFGPHDVLPDATEALWETGFVAPLPSWRLPELPADTFDLFVDAYSFQEMEPDAVDQYAQLVSAIGPRYVASENGTTITSPAAADGEGAERRPTTSDMIVARFERHGYTLVHRFGRPASPPKAELVVLERV